jgi:hypothetical protein
MNSYIAIIIIIIYELNYVAHWSIYPVGYQIILVVLTTIIYIGRGYMFMDQ